jgi:hypothetical protein
MDLIVITDGTISGTSDTLANVPAADPGTGTVRRDSVVVYHAYRPEIGRYAATHGSFDGRYFSFERVS